MRRIVVKLGGSTAYHAEMREWVEILAKAAAPLVVVPGGGPFADRVREAQAQMGFSDASAHFMAILAMEQMGLALLDMSERFSPARTVGEIDAALEHGKVPVWLPSQMCQTAADIAQSWDVTSDSLAAWLAGRIHAEALLLIKQTDAFDAEEDVEGLATAGLVDPMLSSMLRPETGLYLAGPGALATAPQRLTAGDVPGREFAARAAQRGAA
ncbi:dihydroneopterin aldolase [Mesorhizobium sp. KR2-14]|uniref:amino acid kinase family protein n=1 Tax=Mesorhizobium sp. KR2-14 TaxID=3156610 RepID=UPI0032B38DAD